MKRLFLAGALLIAVLVPASPAGAGVYNPTGEYADFNECPMSRPELAACFFSKVTSGSFTTGAKTVPVQNPSILQGGIEFNEALEAQFWGAEGGNTLPKVQQPVPGGLLGVTAPLWWPKFLRDLFNETINNGFTGVQSTIELAAPATSIKVDPNALQTGVGTALSLPVKIKLDNPFLGNNCYIGSNSKPIVINFTTGTTSPPGPNQPITGDSGEIVINPAETIIFVNGFKQVNNSFAVPGASGCGGLFAFLVDPFVNSIVGLPSAAGNNTAILEGDLKLGQPSAVKASE